MITVVKQPIVEECDNDIFQEECTLESIVAESISLWQTVNYEFASITQSRILNEADASSILSNIKNAINKFLKMMRDLLTKVGNFIRKAFNRRMDRAKWDNFVPRYNFEDYNYREAMDKIEDIEFVSTKLLEDDTSFFDKNFDFWKSLDDILLDMYKSKNGNLSTEKIKAAILGEKITIDKNYLTVDELSTIKPSSDFTDKLKKKYNYAEQVFDRIYDQIDKIFDDDIKDIYDKYPFGTLNNTKDKKIEYAETYHDNSVKKIEAAMRCDVLVYSVCCEIVCNYAKQIAKISAIYNNEV